MKLKSLLALLHISIISTMNSCTSDPYEASVTTAQTTPITTPNTPITQVTQTPTPSLDLNNYSYSAPEIQLMDLINTYRVSIGLNSLVKTNYISSKAEEHSNYMLTTNVLSHDNFSIRSQDIMKALGAKSVGENVAYNKSTPQDAFDAWLASPGHKANIEGSYTNFGISVRVSSDGRKYYTNIFAKI
jgi:uncharacterized protein YkwD